MHNRNTKSAGTLRFRLATLGDARLCSVTDQDVTLDILGPGKPFALITYLALSPRRSASREHLLDLLWADLPPDPGRHALRQATYYLRQRMGDDGILTNNGELILAAPLTVDRDEFLKAVDMAHLERAVELYRGDFLAEFALPGGAEFEHWVDAERYRLRLVFLRAAEVVVRQRLSSGRLSDAKALARRVRDLDPRNESGWRLLLEALTASRDSIALATEADALRRMLADDDREPEPATRVALQAATNDVEPDSQETSRGLVAELVGRQYEFSRLIGLWDSAKRGQPSYVHVAAPAGLGKTRLLRDVHARLRAGGARALYLRASPGDRDIPYAFTAELANTICELPGAVAISPAAAAALVAVAPELSSRFQVSPDTSRGEDALRRRTLALAELARCVAEEAPLALLLDDTHWMDPSSRRVLAGMLGRLRESPVFVATAGRLHPGARLPETGAEELTLAPLSDDDIAALLASLGVLPDAPWAKDLPHMLQRATKGSPLLILETLQVALDHEVLTLSDRVWSCTHPDRLAEFLTSGDALRQRLSDLARVDRAVMLTLALAGAPLAIELTAVSTGGDAAAAEASLYLLEKRGLVQRTAAGWEPVHDEIAALAEQLAPEDARRDAHKRIGEALLRAASDDAAAITRAGRHLFLGGAVASLHQAFRQWVITLRNVGDRRTSSELAKEFLGAEAFSTSRRELVRCLPLHIRMGLYSPTRRVTAALLPLAATLGAVAALTRNPEPPVTFLEVAVHGGGDTVRLYEAPLSHTTLDGPGHEIDLRKVVERIPAIGRTWSFQWPPERSPAAPRWLLTRAVPDTGVIDIYLIEGDSTHRLTYAHGDDLLPHWSPDGSAFVFMTARWDPRSSYDLAIMDVRTRAIRPLVRGEGRRFDWPRWSPDGSRIAFLESRPRFTRAAMVCWINVDGTGQQCSSESGSVIAWYDAERLVVYDSDPARPRLSVLDTRTGTSEPVALPSVPRWEQVVLAGPWVAASRVANDDAQWIVFSVERPLVQHTIILPTTDRRWARLAWATGPSTATRYADTVRITRAERPIPLTGIRQLAAIGITAAGDTVQPAVMAWRSLDSTIARVTPDGLAVPVRAGRARIVATAGGWRADTAVVRTVQPRATPLLREEWTDSTMPRWMPFGNPSPIVLRNEGAPGALWNRGDKSFVSGVYSRMTFPVSDGLGLSVSVAVPISDTQWQHVAAQFNALPESELADWDHVWGPLPGVFDRDRGAICGGQVPDVPGPTVGLLGPDGLISNTRLSGELFDGRWFTLTVQILPGGLCAVAVDGVPVLRSYLTVDAHAEYRVVLYGSSVGTRTLHGPLTVWRGVRDDIDWRTLADMSSANPRPTPRASSSSAENPSG